MAITITLQVDVKRLREAGLSDNPADVMTVLEAMRGGRLSLQTGDHWIPVRNLRAWQRLAARGHHLSVVALGSCSPGLALSLGGYIELVEGRD